TPNVGVYVTAVPDGVVTDESGSATFFRLSLALAPKVNPSGDPQFDIMQWPTEIAARAGRIRLAVASIHNPGAPQPLTSPRFVRCLQQSDIEKASGSAATLLWQRIFHNGQSSAAGFQELVENLRQEAARRQPQSVPKEALGTFHEAGLAALIEAIYAGPAISALSTRAIRAEASAARGA